MERIINEATEKLKKGFEEFFSEEQPRGISEAEAYFSHLIADVTLEVLREYYEELDRQYLEDKASRKQMGLRVEHRSVSREILTELGELTYSRTYYRKASGGYEYPVDRIVGISSYARLSDRVGLALAEASSTMSYEKASRYIAGEHVTKQTVMNKLREAGPRAEPVEYRKVQELHIDADEDHVHLQNGQSTVVPLISVYEGIERQGNRGVCRNVFHISEYGKDPQTLWEEVSDEIERRYDLSEARIYLHGDGAAWIREGLNWLPKSQFVLDSYHKNKAIKQALSGIDRKAGSQYEHLIRQALKAGDRKQLRYLWNRLLERYPEREKTISDNMGYLWNNIDAIAIAERDESARNGGCTEPHVSHILSARLSSRPMGWSRKTLRHLVPILAAGGAAFETEEEQKASYPPASQFLQTVRKSFLPNTLGLADPDHSVTFPARQYKVTPLFNALRPF